jgi:hypothetical protein
MRSRRFDSIRGSDPPSDGTRKDPNATPYHLPKLIRKKKHECYC